MGNTSNTGPIWACYLGPTWVLYGRAHMSLTVWDSHGSYIGKPVYIPQWAHMGLIAVWAPHGSNMGVPIFACPYTVYPYGSIITHGVHMGLLSGTALYPTISTSSQSEILEDLDKLERWSHTWDMAFNPSKCHNKVQKHNSYTVYSSQLHTGICIFSNFFINTLVSTSRQG